jgi:uncharacterized protein YodC (DUF2158 family)
VDIRSQFWTGETGRRIRGNNGAQLLALYLMTCPKANQTGLFVVTSGDIGHDLGFSPVATRNAKTALLDAGFMAYDEDNSWIWIYEMLRFQIGDTMRAADKRNIGVQRYIDQHAKMPFVREFIQKYGESHNLVYSPPKQTIPLITKAPKLLFDDEPEPEPPPLPEMKAGPVMQAKQIREVIAHYRTYHPGRFKAIAPGAVEWRHIVARLNEGVTVDEMKKAIDGMMRCPWHQGQNDRRRKYDSLELVTRSSRKIHELIEVPLTATPVITDKNATTVSAIQSRRAKRAAASKPPESMPDLPHPLDDYGNDPFHPSLRDDHDENDGGR